MWQKLNPDQNAFAQNLTEPTFTDPRGYEQTQDTPLLPFFRTNQPKASPVHFWTSADCWDTNVMGYTYEDSDLSVPALTTLINNRYQWLANPPPPPARPRPQPRALTNFPVDFGEYHANARCLPNRVFLDGRDMWPSPYIHEGALIRAVRSIEPEMSGVDSSERRTIDAVGADSDGLVPTTAFAAVINTNSIRLWDLLVQFEKYGWCPSTLSSE